MTVSSKHCESTKQQQLETEEQAIDVDMSEHDLTARSGDDEIEVQNPDGPEATALTELEGNEPATTALAKENITRTVTEENVENVCIPSHPQAQLATNYKIDSPKSYSSDRQEDTSALLENDESMSNNLMTEAEFYTVRWTVRLSYNPHDPHEAKYDEVHCCKSRSFIARCKRSSTELQRNSSKIRKECRIGSFKTG